jgi:hypothetical protein
LIARFLLREKQALEISVASVLGGGVMAAIFILMMNLILSGNTQVTSILQVIFYLSGMGACGAIGGCAGIWNYSKSSLQQQV